MTLAVPGIKVELRTRGMTRRRTTLPLAGPLLVQLADRPVKRALLGLRRVGRVEVDVKHVEDRLGLVAGERDRVVCGADQRLLDRVRDSSRALDAVLAELACCRSPEILGQAGRGLVSKRVEGLRDVEDDGHGHEGSGGSS
jgi:hypothetical protein